jgi:acetoacetyl-CoA reductase
MCRWRSRPHQRHARERLWPHRQHLLEQRAEGAAWLTNYCAAKAGVIGFTRALALESARKGITVNAIAPGYVATDLLSGVSDEVMKAIVGQIPVGRLGEAEEVARCVVFLAADEAAWITGSTLTINGGQFMD